MNIILGIGISFLAVYCVVMLAVIFKSKYPFKNFLFCALFGILLIFAVNFTSKFTGVSIPVNLYTLLCGGAAGPAGVILILMLNIILV